MKAIIYVAILLIGYVMCQGFDEFPTDGKTFYADFHMDPNTGRHYVNMHVGSNL